MKKGDLIECLWGEIGIVLYKLGPDRYMIYWRNGERYPLNRCNLFYIGERT